MSDIILDIYNSRLGGIGCISLNRPDVLNAINHSMFIEITNKLLEWQSNDEISLVIIQSAKEKVFCAGGDLKEIYHKRHQIDSLLEYFFYEYRLIKLIGDYPKPIISILDGYTMGGGVGLGMHVKYPIATPNFIFAMPETLIGLFPDVGGKYLLANLPGQMGKYLGLTSRSINHKEAEQIGLVKYMIADGGQQNFKDGLFNLNSLNELELYLDQYLLKQESTGLFDIDKINRHFDNNSVEEIVHSLQKDNNQWSQKVLEELQICSPISLKVTLRAMQLAAHQNLEDCLYTDYRIVNRMLHQQDFFEGIRAKIIDKDNQPSWYPSKLEDITDEQVLDFFEPLENEIAWL